MFSSLSGLHAVHAARTQKIQQSAPAGSLSPRSIDSDEAQADAQLSAREGGNDAKMTRGSIISSTVMCILMDEIILYFILGSFYNIEFAYLHILLLFMNLDHNIIETRDDDHDLLSITIYIIHATDSSS